MFHVKQFISIKPAADKYGGLAAYLQRRMRYSPLLPHKIWANPHFRNVSAMPNRNSFAHCAQHVDKTVSIFAPTTQKAPKKTHFSRNLWINAIQNTACRRRNTRQNRLHNGQDEPSEANRINRDVKPDMHNAYEAHACGKMRTALILSNQRASPRRACHARTVKVIVRH